MAVLSQFGPDQAGRDVTEYWCHLAGHDRTVGQLTLSER